MTTADKPGLFMIWPTSERPLPIDPATASGYTIRTYQPGDQDAFLGLMAQMDFDPFDAEKLHFNITRVLPAGWFFALHQASGQIVGTAMCLHNYTGNTPFGGDVGWLACDSDHTGHGLGYSLTAYVTNRFREAGYTRIQLGTEHYRLPAIKTYLKLGYLPVLYRPEMGSIWEEICTQIGWDFTPDRWFATFPPSPLGAG